MNLYQNLVFSICLKLTGDYFTAEDLTQETFISAYKNWNSFDGKNEKAWLCRIAGNKAIDYMRSSAVRAVATPDEQLEDSVASTGEELPKKIINSEIMNELENCCKALSPPYDEIARDYFILGKNAREIADERQINLKTAQTQVYRARDSLKKIYRKELLT